MNQNNNNPKGKNKIQLLLTPRKIEHSLHFKNRNLDLSSYYQHYSPRTILPTFTPQKKKPQISFVESKYKYGQQSIVRPRNIQNLQSSLMKGSVQQRLIPDETFTYTIKFAARTRKGMQAGNAAKVNQDTFITCAKIEEQMHLFAVCDGHGENGHLVSGFVKTQLPFLVSKNKTLLEKNTPQGLMSIFQTLSERLKSSQIDISFSGSTIVIIFLHNNKLYSGNLGDSRAVLLNRNNKWNLKQLSRDHKPNCKDEAERILANGGRIDPLINSLGLFVGPLRVWTNQNVPGLAMSRSIGDEVAHSVGVSDKPEIQQFDLEKNDKAIIIGSDGVFEFLSEEQLINCIAPYYDNMNLDGACNQLMLSACNSWLQRCNNLIDDITFIILFLSY